MANDFLTFATSGTANVYTNAEYAADADHLNGNQPGIAKSKLTNKAIRQSSIMSTVLAQYIVDKTGNDAIDDGTTATLLADLKKATDVAANIHAATAKTTPADADEIGIADSAASYVLKKLTWANAKATLKTYFDTLYVALAGDQTVAGIKTFSSSPIVPSSPTTAGQAIPMGGIIEKTAVGIGYGAGSGGTVTQATSKSTAVTLNKPTGRITMNNAALAAGASVNFLVNNTAWTGFDTVGVIIVGGVSDTRNYRVEVTSASVTGFYIRVTNLSAGSLSEAVEIHFNITKGWNA